jgi:small subunit ribosomal protein MRP21
MELRRIGDAVLRSQISPLTFLTPSISSRCPHAIRTTINSTHKQHVQRYSDTASKYAARPTVTTSLEPPSSSTSTSEKPPTDDSLDWLSKSFDSSRTSQFSSPRAQVENRSTSPFADRNSRPRTEPTADEKALNQGNSASDLLASINSARSIRSGMRSNPRNNFDISRMATPPNSNSSSVPRFEVSDLMNDINREISSAPAPRPAMRLNPTTGRTVHIQGAMDLSRGMRLLELSCSKNKVRSDFTKQRFHERPGLRRKRLKSQRWRKRFQEGFKATVTRVKQLKTQGW